MDDNKNKKWNKFKYVLLITAFVLGIVAIVTIGSVIMNAVQQKKTLESHRLEYYNNKLEGLMKEAEENPEDLDYINKVISSAREQAAKEFFLKPKFSLSEQDKLKLTSKFKRESRKNNIVSNVTVEVQLDYILIAISDPELTVGRMFRYLALFEETCEELVVTLDNYNPKCKLSVHNNEGMGVEANWAGQLKESMSTVQCVFSGYKPDGTQQVRSGATQKLSFESLPVNSEVRLDKLGVPLSKYVSDYGSIYPLLISEINKDLSANKKKPKSEENIKETTVQYVIHQVTRTKSGNKPQYLTYTLTNRERAFLSSIKTQLGSSVYMLEYYKYFLNNKISSEYLEGDSDDVVDYWSLGNY